MIMPLDFLLIDARQVEPDKDRQKTETFYRYKISFMDIFHGESSTHLKKNESIIFAIAGDRHQISL